MELRDVVIEAILDMEVEETVELLIPIYNDRDYDGIYTNDEEGYQYIINEIGIESFVYKIVGCGDKVYGSEFIRYNDGLMDALNYSEVYELLIEMLVDEDYYDYELEQIARTLGINI